MPPKKPTKKAAPKKPTLAEQRAAACAENLKTTLQREALTKALLTSALAKISSLEDDLAGADIHALAVAREEHRGTLRQRDEARTECAKAEAEVERLTNNLRAANADVKMTGDPGIDVVRRAHAQTLAELAEAKQKLAVKELVSIQLRDCDLARASAVASIEAAVPLFLEVLADEATLEGWSITGSLRARIKVWLGPKAPE